MALRKRGREFWLHSFWIGRQLKIQILLFMLGYLLVRSKCLTVERSCFCSLWMWLEKKISVSETALSIVPSERNKYQDICEESLAPLSCHVRFLTWFIFSHKEWCGTWGNATSREKKDKWKKFWWKIMSDRILGCNYCWAIISGKTAIVFFNNFWVQIFFWKNNVPLSIYE